MVGASAATTTPAANSASPTSSGRTGPVRSTMRPAAAMANICGIITAEKAQAYSSASPRSAAAAGIAVTTAIPSNATAVMQTSSPSVRVRRDRDMVIHSITASA